MKTRSNPFLRLSSILAATIAITTSAHAADFTWEGTTGSWSDLSWNDGTNSGLTGPTTAGNNATITNGPVWANVGVGGVDSITVGVGGQLGFWNGVYQGVGNLNLQGGTVIGNNSYNAYGASILGNLTISGTAASTITGNSWFNLGSSTTFTVADATGDSASDLLVNLSLRSLPGSPDWTYLYNSKIVKEGAGTMEMTVHSYFNAGLDLNGGTLKVSNGNGGYGYFASAVNVNSGTTLTINSDGTGFGFLNGWKPTSVNINGGTVNGGGNHIWGISGGVNMTGGTLQSASFQWNYTNLNTNASADTATVAGPLNLRGDGGYTGLSANVADGAAATDLLISGNITELYGALGISKSGAGTMVLSGTSSTYTGATTVSAGTLLVTGALGNSAVSVNGGAFGGTGTVGSSLTINSGGLFHVVNLLDSLDVSGTVSLFAGFGIDDLAGLDWGSVANGTYTLINGTLGSGVFDGLSNNSLATAYNIGGGRSAYFQQGSLQLVVIPEPRAALLGGLGLLMLLRRRRA